MQQRNDVLLYKNERKTKLNKKKLLRKYVRSLGQNLLLLLFKPEM